MENQIEINNQTQNKSNLPVVVAAILLVLITASVLYFVFTGYWSVEQLSKVVSNDNLQTDSSQIKSITPFFLHGASPEYMELMYSFREISNQISKSDKILPEDKYVTIYKMSNLIYLNENLPAKERAYALNVLNVLYLQGFNSGYFKTFVKGNDEFNAQFNKHLTFIQSQKGVSGGNVKGAVFDTGNISENYATQKTLAYINSVSNKIYPNSYAVLRGSINTVQADYLLYKNYEFGKKYKNYDDFVSKYYTKEYVQGLENQIKAFREEGTLYRDVNISSNEIDTMITNGLLMTFKYPAVKNDPTKLTEKQEVLREVIYYSDHAISENKKYDLLGKNFYAAIIPMDLKVRVAKENVLSAEENDRQIKDANDLFLGLMQTNNNNFFRYFIKNLPKEGYFYQSIDFLGQRNPEIMEYVKSIRG